MTLFAPPTKVQGSFPGATVTVFLAGTTTLATIYNDDQVTAKANPFTADQQDGMWFFYAANGRYDVQFSGGGIPQPFTIGALGDGTIANYLGAAYLSAADYPGANAGQSIRAAIMALPQPTGGTVDVRSLYGASNQITQDLFAGVTWPVELIFGAGTYTFTVPQTISPKLHVRGLGGTMSVLDTTNRQSFTQLTFTGTGYLFQTASGTAVPSGVTFSDFQAQINNPGTGWLLVGSVNTDYSESNFRENWVVRNVMAVGNGCSTGGCTLTAGTIGMSVTQLICHRFDNVTMWGFERPAIIDRCGNGTWTRCRFDVFRFGTWITEKGGTGAPPPGGSLDVFIGCEFSGPQTSGTAGVDYGYTLEVSAQNITMINTLYEVNQSSRALLALTSVDGSRGSSAQFTDINGGLSYNSATSHLDNTFVFGNAFFSPKFFGTVLSIPITPTITFGSLYTFAAGGQAKFVQCSAPLNTLVRNADPNGNNAIIDGQYSNTTLLRTASISEFSGMIRVEGSSLSFVPDTGGKGLEMFYSLGSDEALITSYDRGSPGGFKPILVQASATEFNQGIVQCDHGLEVTSAAPGRFDGPIVFTNYLQAGRQTLTANSTTPSVAAGFMFDANNPSPTSITNFTGGVDGQMILVRGGNGNTTLIDSALIQMKLGSNVTLTINQVMTFYNVNGNWLEISRNF